jgi:hypothetical protein
MSLWYPNKPGGQRRHIQFRHTRRLTRIDRTMYQPSRYIYADLSYAPNDRDCGQNHCGANLHTRFGDQRTQAATIEYAHSRRCRNYYLTQRDAVKFVKRLLTEDDGVKAVLQRLDRLTQHEVRSTAVDTLKVVHSLVHNMSVVLEGKQTYSVCTRHIFNISLKMEKHQSTMFGNCLVCFVGNSGQVPVSK